MSIISSRKIEEGLQQAYQLAVQAYQEDEVPVGSCIMCDGKIIAKGYNQIKQKKNATSHAELKTIQKASSVLKNERLTDCILFTTLEPCTLCTGAIILSRIKAVYFLVHENKAPSMVQVLTLQQYNHYPLWFLCQEQEDKLQYSKLLKQFFKDKRWIEKYPFLHK